MRAQAPPGDSGGESIRRSLPGYHALGPDVCPGISLYPGSALPKRIYIGRLSSGHGKRLFVDQQSRKAAGPAVSGSGAAMPRPAATSATAARSLDFSSETFRSLRSRSDRRKGRRQARSAEVGRVGSPSGDPFTVRRRTAMLSARLSRTTETRRNKRSSEGWLRTWY